MQSAKGCSYIIEKVAVWIVDKVNEIIEVSEIIEVIKIVEWSSKRVKNVVRAPNSWSALWMIYYDVIAI